MIVVVHNKTLASSLSLSGEPGCFSSVFFILCNILADFFTNYFDLAQCPIIQPIMERHIGTKGPRTKLDKHGRFKAPKKPVRVSRRSPRLLRTDQLRGLLSLTATTDREQTLMDNTHDLRPLHDPLFPFENVSKVRPEQYLLPYASIPYGKVVADWTQDFFGLAQRPNFRKERHIEPIRPNAPTTISLFYYDESSKRPLDTYMRRIQDMADMGEQTIIYVPPSLAKQVKAMRSDIHWCVVSDFKT